MKQLITSKRIDSSGYFSAVGCFAVCLVLYLLTACPTVPPYRDSGELITSSYTLSVAHSPGYPLYMVLGKFFISLGNWFGFNPAWCLNMFSGVAGAVGVLLLVFMVYILIGNIGACIFSGLLAGFAYINWYLAVVSEMYSLNLALAVFLLYLIVKSKFVLFGFISGLALGNHLTSVFVIIPMLIYVFISGNYRKIIWKSVLLYFIIGCSVYLYLPIRAQAQPFINWGEPSNLSALWNVISRAAYGRTLDLVSREVTLSQVFFPHLLIFARSLARDLTPAGLGLACLGVIWGIKSYRMRTYSLMLILIFILTGPFFLFLAKMPTNPHAVAIVEVGYMLPTVVLSIFAGLGLFFIIENVNSKILKYGIYTFAAAILIWGAMKTYPKVNMSKNFFAEDYALNILNSVERNAVVIMRRDHTMFSLWYKRDVEGVRKDIRVISKGLLSAAWYRNKLKIDHPEIEWKKEYINDEDYIEWFYEKYAGKFPIYLTPAAAGELSEKFFGKYFIQPFGLILKIVRKNVSFDTDTVLSFIEKKYRLTGEYRTTKYYDFFTRDFITLYAHFYDKIGIEYLKNNNISRARDMHTKAVAFDPLYPKPYSNLAYTYFTSGNFEQAEQLYLKAIEKANQRMKQYTRKQFFKKELAEYYNNLGTVYEKWLRTSKNDEYFRKALENYDKSIQLKPSYSQAYYNKGVLYWRRDWNKVVENFKKALDYDPENKQFKRYLIIANKNLRK